MQSGSDPAPMEDIMAHDHNHDHDHASAAALDRPEHELAVCPVMPRNVVVNVRAVNTGCSRAPLPSCTAVTWSTSCNVIVPS